jgi:hypothetical protein
MRLWTLVSHVVQGIYWLAKEVFLASRFVISDEWGLNDKVYCRYHGRVTQTSPYHNNLIRYQKVIYQITCSFTIVTNIIVIGRIVFNIFFILFIANYYFLLITLATSRNFICLVIFCGPGSSVGMATGYWMDGPGIESRWVEIFRTCPGRLWDPPSLLYNGYRAFPGGKERPGRDADPSPHSSAVGH